MYFAFVEQEAAQQELSQQKEQYEERVTHLHEAMVSAVKSRAIIGWRSATTI